MAWDEAQYAIDEIKKSMGSGQANGIPPVDMDDLVSISTGNGEVTIRCTSPSDTIVEGQLLCTVKGVRIVRKTGSAPVDENDGVFISDVPAGTTFNQKDTGLSNGVHYYYGFFPYSDHGVFNIDPRNVRTTAPQAYQFWAFDQNFSDLNPKTTITYPTGFQNSSFKKMLTNKDDSAVTAGGWLPFLQETLKNYPYVVKASDATADYALNPMNYTLKMDGSGSDINSSSYDGGFFAWINKIYMREDYSSDGNSREVQFSNGPADGFIPVGFYDQDRNELEGVWIPMCGITSYTNYRPIFASGYTIQVDRSPYWLKTKSVDTFFRGVCFGGPIMNVLRDLMFMMFKTTYIKNVSGWGMVGYGASIPNYFDQYSSIIIPGWYGTGDRKTSNLCFHSMLIPLYYYGIYDPYYVVHNNKLFLSPYYEYSDTGAGYVDTGITIPNNKTVYPTHLKKSTRYWGSMVDPDTNGGSNTTGLTTSFQDNGSSTSKYVLLKRLGAESYSGITAENLALNFSSSSSYTTAAPMILPPVGYSPFS